MLTTEGRALFTPEHEQFRNSVRRFLDRELSPNLSRWESNGVIDRSFWLACGKAGLLCPTVPEAYGGLGLDFLYNAIIGEELGYLGVFAGITLQSDIIADYFVHYGSEAQKLQYLPRLISGEFVAAIAMTEPGAGSDLQGIRASARRDGDDYIVNGSKTFISNGQNADIVIVVVSTTPALRGKGLSLILVEAQRDGFRKGRNLDKIGQWCADTSELYFDDVRVPASNLLGAENQGFACLMAQLSQERLSIALSAQAMAQRALDEAVGFSKQREAFGKRVFEFQHTRFALADLAASVQVGWAHLDWCLGRHLKGELTAAEAAAAKYWHTETLWRVVDASLQLHGGAGYMNETTVARLWRDARVQRIYGGTSEIMREVISRAL